MPSKTERDLIVDYALENESNLEVALKIGFAFYEVRKRIITDFIKALEDDMKRSLGDEWVFINQLKENPFDRFKGFHIVKKEWNNYYWIGIESQQRNAREFIIGVSKDKERRPSLLNGGRLKSLIDMGYRQGTASEWWEWYQWIEGIYQNWDNEEVLIQLHKKDEAMNYLKDHILRIREIAEPVIDEAVKSK